eukprot:1895295-Karenia_brevis.AAC.1
MKTLDAKVAAIERALVEQSRSVSYKVTAMSKQISGYMDSFALNLAESVTGITKELVSAGTMELQRSIDELRLQLKCWQVPVVENSLSPLATLN